MYELDVQPVLRCGQCNKPFDKQSTLKRHGYYCRSRRAGSTTRSRSCVSCARGKARCDNRRPECSRCTTKAIECHYPANTPKGTGQRTQPSNNAPTERRSTAPSLVAGSPSIDNCQEASNDGDIIPDSALIISDLELANIGEENLDWHDPDIGFPDFWNLQANDETAQNPSLGPTSVVRHPTPSADRTFQGQQVISSHNGSIPASPTSTIRSLTQRPKMKTGTQRIANLILHTLNSYPRMMLRHNALPPFIHPCLISSDIENIHMEPLTNCISLVHMISSGVQGSRKLFWKNVRLECERLYAENLKLNKWELLAAMQALSIYILIRLDEGETDHNNFDFLLLTTVVAIAKQLTYIDITRNYDPETSWEDWIFEESTRRLCVVYQVVNMLVYFDPAAICDLHTDLILAPLPAKKLLWEAGDEFVWKAESEREPGVQIAFGMAANGELVKLGEDQLYCNDAVQLHKSSDARTRSRGTASWEEWCSGMDGFGGLVMLAASLVG